MNDEIAFSRRLSRALSRAAVEAARGAARRPLLPLAAFGTLAICLLLTGVMSLGAWNLGRLSKGWSGGGHMTVYLDDETSSLRAAQIAEAVRHLPGVVGTQLIAPKEAHARLKAALGSRGELLDGVEESFLPASIEVQLLPGVGAMLRAHPGYERLASAPGVEEVDLHAETTERIEAVRMLVVRGAFVVGLLVALATLYLVAMTIRLGVEARRHELSVLRLVGATERYIRAPFLIEGLVTGALGASVASVALWAMFRAIAPRITASLGTWLAAAPLAFFPASTVALAIVGGAMLGMLGASAAFSRDARA